VVVGIGVEAKPQVGLVAVVMAATLIVVGPRWPLRSWWAAGGVIAATVLAAPYVIWQQQHGWPQLTVAGNIAGSQEGGRAGFFPFQLVMVSPLLVPVWVAGLRAPFRRAGWQRLRFVPITFAATALLYFAGNGHAYYLASLYPVLLALGAPATAEWMTRRAPRRTRVFATAVALSAAVSAIIALPLLPERDLQGSVVMALNPAQGETVGWPAFVQTVSRHGGRSLAPTAGTPRSSPPTTARPGRSISSDRNSDSRAPIAATTASANGEFPEAPTPAPCSSASTTPQTPRPPSSNAARSPSSTIASASTTTSRVSRSCSAEPPARGQHSGRTSRTTTNSN
jgi:hypothetical protein